MSPITQDTDTVQEKNDIQASNLIQPNAENSYTVSKADLPLSCPMPGMHLWNSHPKVFLPIEETGTAMCPYCSTTYSLQEDRGDI
jgi:uncharacterized Zn-finger protein